MSELYTLIDIDPSLYVKLDNFTQSVLYREQKDHVCSLVSCLQYKPGAIDGSNTGSGKTYSAIATVRRLGLKPIIICPNVSTSSWKDVCRLFDTEPVSIINYESLNRECSIKGVVEWDKVIEKFKWIVPNPRRCVAIFDEAHKCKSMNSFNGMALIEASKKFKTLLLSATICDKPKSFLVYGYVLGFYKSIKSGRRWVDRLYAQEKRELSSKDNILHKFIFPEYGSKMVNKIDDYDNEIEVATYPIEKKVSKKIDRSYEKMSKAEKANRLSLITKLREKVEKSKINIIIREADKYLNEGNSVVIFINYRSNFAKLEEHFNYQEISKIYGGQTDADRQYQIENFQTNRNKIILIMIQAGGTSISLHDQSGKNPRVSLISPSFSGIELVQALGRIYRCGLNSHVLQKIIYTDTKIEKRLANIIRNKIKFLDDLSKETLSIENFI